MNSNTSEVMVFMTSFPVINPSANAAAAQGSGDRAMLQSRRLRVGRRGVGTATAPRGPLTLFAGLAPKSVKQILSARGARNGLRHVSR